MRRGSSLRSVSHQLAQGGVLRSPWKFTLLVKLMGKQSDIKAGNYQLDHAVTPLQLFYKITRGDVTEQEITLIEGWRFQQVRQALNDDPKIAHLSRGMRAADIMRRIGAPGKNPEGLFFPDTYYFPADTSDLAILKRAYQTMKNHLAVAWHNRSTGLPFSTPYDALILASMIEKETGQGKERPLIAGVFINRLKRGMRLQSDPTVIYGLGAKFNGNLHKKDLVTDTAYNTYTRAGLPPTPIAMPGLASINAALHPAKTRDLYFVAKGNGAHQFSETLAEHIRAVRRYQLGER
ncbi:MAG TPA: endolytic transglycosylase MltG [Betaproteobacteria bacterium]|nr:endolytic transglycosylase MltG [Betaproteobacteria bacterium]